MLLSATGCGEKTQPVKAEINKINEREATIQRGMSAVPTTGVNTAQRKIMAMPRFLLCLG